MFWSVRGIRKTKWSGCCYPRTRRNCAPCAWFSYSQHCSKSSSTYPDNVYLLVIDGEIFQCPGDGVIDIADHQIAAAGFGTLVGAAEIRMNVMIPTVNAHIDNRVTLLVIAAPCMKANDQWPRFLSGSLVNISPLHGPVS